MNPKKYHLKYNLGGDSPLVRMNFLIPRAQYENLLKLKNEEGSRINFFVQKAIEKAFKEREKKE
jgi:hypothetical protein